MASAEIQDRSAAASNDGWVTWCGGKCPIEGRDTEYQTRHRDGFVSDVRTLGAFGHRRHIWAHDEAQCDVDIIAYRLVSA
jgi:hypothetical protein